MTNKREEILGGQQERKIPTERKYEKEKKKKDNIYIIERESKHVALLKTRR
jgi:hypothetical protein